MEHGAGIIRPVKFTNRESINMRKIKAGFVGFGEINTPRELIRRLCREARAQLPAAEFEIIETVPVSDDPAGRDVRRAAENWAAAISMCCWFALPAGFHRMPCWA